MPQDLPFRALVENAPDIIARYDRDLRHVYVNPAVERLTGHPPEHFIGKTSEEAGILGPDLAEDWKRALRAAFEEGREQTREFRIDRPGGVIWTDTRFVPELAEDGSVRTVLEISRDITARKEAEAGLRRTRDHLRAVLDASPVAIVGFDLDGRVTTWNPAAERTFGWDAEEVVGSGIPRVPDASWGRVREICGRVVEGETVTDAEVELHTRRLRKVAVSVAAAPLHGGSGSGITGVLAILDDVTERRRAAARLMTEILPAVEEAGVRYDETLLRHRDGSEIPVSVAVIAHPDEGGRVAFRSMVARDLRPRKALEDRLRHSQRMEAVGRLAGGVAHEFNNVLTMLRGHVDLALLTEGLPDGLRDDLEQIVEGIRRAARLTGQLTAFARRQWSRPRIVDLKEVVRGAEPALGAVAGHAVDLRIEAEGTGHRVDVDPAQIEEALLAMTLNARDAMPGGGELRIDVGRIRVEEGDEAEWRVPVKSGRYVALRVSDTGEGMDAATRERVFEPFFTTRDPARSSGLGLSGVYGIVKQNRGYVTVRSEPGEGATFTLLFPAAEGAGDGPSTREREGALPSAGGKACP